MSQKIDQVTLTDDEDVAEPHVTDDDLLEILEDHRDTLKRLADSDLPLAEDAQRALNRLEERR